VRRTITFLVIAAIVAGLWWLVQPRRFPPGELVSGGPKQTPLTAPAGPFEKAGFTITPLAGFEIEARVLHTKRYYHTDVATKLAPRDVAVGWGPMSDQSVLDKLTISQGNRFFFWEYQDHPPIPRTEITSHATNMHLIASTSTIAWRIAWTRAGSIIRLGGFLVEVTGKNMTPWRSSLRRDDDGKGACEIVWVEKYEVLR
jgi:hypothetical protein